MRRAAVLLLLLFCGVAPAQVVKLPATASGPAGVPVSVTAEADGKTVAWVTPDPGLVVIDGSFFGGDTKKALVFGPEGKFRLWAFCAKGDVISPKAECVITFGTPPPGPGPGPTPPTDPFSKAVWDAYAGETSATKAADVAAWAKAFDAVAGKVDSLATYGDLNAALKAALAGAGALPRVQAVLAPELNAAFGGTSTLPLDKPTVKKELAKIAAALKGVK